MPLTSEQQQKRKGKLTASRVGVLMRGDAAAIYQLYQELIGEAEPVDLSGVWPVRLGEATEELNIEWFERSNHMPVSRRGEVVVHPHFPFACTLDGWIEQLACPFEAKHVGGREPLEVVIERYQPQVQFQMYLTKSSQCALSIIQGANQPVVEFVEFAETYAGELFKRARQFMDCVERRIIPVALPLEAAPVVADKTIDMSSDNVWGSCAAEWLEHRPAFEKCQAAEKTLKARVPQDAKKAFGNGVRITRDRAGRLSLREDKP